MSFGQTGPAAKDGTSLPLSDPLVVLKQSSIKGKVFLLSEEGKDVKGSEISIEVRKKGETDVLYKTTTDGEGSFALPNMDVGSYSLKIGRLSIELRVEEFVVEDGAKATRKIPKTVLVYIPEDMR